MWPVGMVPGEPSGEVGGAAVGGGVGQGVGPRAVGRAVVGHHPLDGDAQPGEPGQSAAEEGHRTFLALVGEDLAVGEPGGVVDADVQEVPAEPMPAQDQAHGGDRPAQPARDGGAGQPLPPQRQDLGLGRLAQPSRAGMRPRVAVAQADFARAACQACPLRTVLAVTPKAAATSATVLPSAKRRTIRSRPLGVGGMARGASQASFFLKQEIFPSIARLHQFGRSGQEPNLAE